MKVAKMTFVLPAFHPAPGTVVGTFLRLTDGFVSPESRGVSRKEAKSGRRRRRGRQKF